MRGGIFKTLPSVIVENDFLRTEFVPSYGCKVVSVKSKKTNREFLYQAKEKILKIPPYAASFSDYDSSGYDEVFPSIDRCPYPASGICEGIIVPDHGEIWAMTWEITEKREYGFTARVKSPKFPYIFERKVEIKDNSVNFEYSVINTSDKETFKFIWALHALLACTPQTELLIPKNLNRIMTVEHSTKTLGKWGTLHNYPKTKSVEGKIIDMSKTRPAAEGSCEKFYFTSENTEGWCGALHRDTGEKLIYRYDADKIPYLGVWKTQGGYKGDYNIALEPCSGVYDNLYIADKIRKVSQVARRGVYKWRLTMSMEN
jgi:galactose mutarotase-like enzyme